MGCFSRTQVALIYMESNDVCQVLTISRLMLLQVIPCCSFLQMLDNKAGNLSVCPLPGNKVTG